MLATLGAFPWGDEVPALCFGLLTLYVAKMDWEGSGSYAVVARTWGDAVAVRFSGLLFPGAVWWLSIAVAVAAAYGGDSNNLAIEVACRTVTGLALLVTLASVVLLVYVLIKGPPRRLVPPSRRN